MAEQALKPKSSWGPMIVFFAVVVGAVAFLWWMSRPSTASSGDKSSSTSTTAEPGSPKGPIASGAPAMSAGPPSGARDLCNVDQVKKFIASQLAAGEVPDAELTQVASQVMAMLKQANLAERGCVSGADVSAALYEMVNEGEGEEPN